MKVGVDGWGSERGGGGLWGFLIKKKGRKGMGD